MLASTDSWSVYGGILLILISVVYLTMPYNLVKYAE